MRATRRSSTRTRPRSSTIRPTRTSCTPKRRTTSSSTRRCTTRRSTYIIHRLAREKQRGLRFEHRDVAPPRRDPIAIPAGRATLGARRDAIPFGWDNEFDEHAVDVGAFGVDAHDVTNGDYLAFVRDGGPVPPNWFERDGAWMLRAMFEDLPLPLSWPVWCSQEQADGVRALERRAV